LDIFSKIGLKFAFLRQIPGEGMDNLGNGGNYFWIIISGAWSRNFETTV